MDSPNNILFAHLGELTRLLGHASRIELLEQLTQGERSVEMLSQLTGLSVASTSQHLQNLKKGNFVVSRRQGKHIIYRLGDGPVLSVLASLRCFAEYHNEEIKRIVQDYQSGGVRMEAIGREELLERLSSDTVTLLDVRPEKEYVGGHLPGALNVPIAELQKRLAELPKDKEIVAYCRGPYCVLSVEAVEYLRQRGFKVRRYDEGFPEWKAAGLVVE